MSSFLTLPQKLLTLLSARRGHFQMESGYHSESWFDLRRLFDDRERLQPFVTELANRFAALRVDALCGPKEGGAYLADLVAKELKVESFFSERFIPPKADGLFPVKYFVPEKFRAQLRGKAIALVDDAISAGSAVRGTHADLLACGARPVALGALVVLGDAAAEFAAQQNIPLETIAQMAFGLWKPAECPWCQSEMPLEKVSDSV